MGAADGRTSPTQGCGHCHMSAHPNESADKDNRAEARTAAVQSVSELWVNRMGDEGEKKRVRDVPVRQGCGRRANARGEY